MVANRLRRGAVIGSGDSGPCLYGHRRGLTRLVAAWLAQCRFTRSGSAARPRPRSPARSASRRQGARPLRPAAAAIRFAQGRKSMSGAGPRASIRSPGCSSARACRSRSSPNSRTGGASATATARKAGSIRACSRASRTALVAPWRKERGHAAVCRAANAAAGLVAMVKAGVVGDDRRLHRRLVRVCASAAMKAGSSSPCCGASIRASRSTISCSLVALAA